MYFLTMNFVGSSMKAHEQTGTGKGMMIFLSEPL